MWRRDTIISICIIWSFAWTYPVFWVTIIVWRLRSALSRWVNRLIALDCIIEVIEMWRLVLSHSWLDLKTLSFFTTQIVILLEAAYSLACLISRVAIFIGYILLRTLIFLDDLWLHYSSAFLAWPDAAREQIFVSFWCHLRRLGGLLTYWTLSGCPSLLFNLLYALFQLLLNLQGCGPSLHCTRGWLLLPMEFRRRVFTLTDWRLHCRGRIRKL